MVPVTPFERRRRRRREQRREGAAAGEVVLLVRGEQRAGRPRRRRRASSRLRSVIRIWSSQKPTVRVVGLVDLRRGLAVPQRTSRSANAETSTLDHVVGVAVIPLAAGAGRDVGVLALEDRRRGGERRAALPLLDDARVARVRHRARPEVGARRRPCRDPSSRSRSSPRAARSRPSTNLLRARGRTRARRSHRRRRATALTQAALVLRIQAVAPFHTQLAFSALLSASTSITVSHFGLSLRVLGERRAPPQAARVRVVLPEVVEPLALLDAYGTLSFASMIARTRVLGLREPGHGLERGLASSRSARAPSRATCVLDLLEPQVRILDGRRRGDGHRGCAQVRRRAAGGGASGAAGGGLDEPHAATRIE